MPLVVKSASRIASPIDVIKLLRSGGVYVNTPLPSLYTRVPPPAGVADWTERSDSERPPPPPPVKSFAGFHIDEVESHLRTWPFWGAEVVVSTSVKSSIDEYQVNNSFHSLLNEAYALAVDESVINMPGYCVASCIVISAVAKLFW